MPKLSNLVSILYIILPPLTAPETDSSLYINKQIQQMLLKAGLLALSYWADSAGVGGAMVQVYSVNEKFNRLFGYHVYLNSGLMSSVEMTFSLNLRLDF